MYRNYSVLSLTLLIFSFSSLSAQFSVELDSLRSALHATTSDTARANISAHLSKNFILQGIHFDSARIYALKTVDLAEKYQYLPALEKGYFTLAFIYSSEGDLEQGLLNYHKAYDILCQAGKNAALSTVLNNIGKVYFDKGVYDEAQKYFLEARQMAEQHQDTNMMISALGNIAILRNIQEEFSASRAYYLEALSLCRLTANPSGELSIVQNLSGLYEHFGEMDSALWAINRSLNISNQIGSQGGRIRAYASLAKIKIRTEQYQEGLAAIADALPLCDANHQSQELTLLYQLRMKAYTKLKRWDEAQIAGDLCLSFAEKSGRLPNIAFAHQSLQDFRTAKGDFALAMKHQETYYQIKDSMLSQERQAKMDELMTAYETEKKDRSIAELGQKNRIQELEISQKNYLLVLLFAAALLVGFGIYVIYRQKSLKEKQARMEAQQRLLQTQMNPHFLFNALSAIQSLIYEHDDPEEAVFYLARFAKLMRLILENSRESFIPLEQEIRTLELYLELQKLRFEDSFSYEILLEPDMDTESLQIPPMFAQPFIENALEHGLKHREGGHIQIQFKKGQDHLELVVEDNGIGREEALQLNLSNGHRSLATEIIKDRLKLLSDRVKQQFEFQITDLKDLNQDPIGTKVSLSLPLIQSF